MKHWPHPDDDHAAPIGTADLLLAVGLTAFGWWIAGKALLDQLAHWLS